MFRDLVRGAIAGAAATWVMDQVTTSMYNGQPREVTAREEAARPNGRSSVGNMVARLEEATGFELDEDLRATAEQAIHYALGAVPGAIYVALRRHLPFVGVGGGLVYGAVLFLVNDEWLNPTLGLSAPASAYPLEAHERGLVGHLVLGAATDSISKILPL
jgi:hypothetical protein